MPRYEVTCQRLRLFRWLVSTVMEKNAELRPERIAPYLPVYNAIVDSSAFALKLTKIDGRYTSMSADWRARRPAANQYVY